jgi:hypothetical protein
LSIRITGPAEAAEVEWSPNSAWADLIQRIELELEEKILRFKLSITEKPQLEWVWQEQLSRRGMECTILAYIDTGSSAMSVQSKQHLHWKVLEHISSMNNEVEFAALAHNLLRKTDVANTTYQAHKNRTASILAYSQAARKKRLTKLNLTLLMTSQKGSIDLTHTDHKAESEDQKLSSSDHIRLPGLISQPAARNRLTYD